MQNITQNSPLALPFYARECTAEVPEVIQAISQLSNRELLKLLTDDIRSTAYISDCEQLTLRIQLAKLETHRRRNPELILRAEDNATKSRYYGVRAREYSLPLEHGDPTLKVDTPTASAYSACNTTAHSPSSETIIGLPSLPEEGFLSVKLFSYADLLGKEIHASHESIQGNCAPEAESELPFAEQATKQDDLDETLHEFVPASTPMPVCSSDINRYRELSTWEWISLSFSFLIMFACLTVLTLSILS